MLITYCCVLFLIFLVVFHKGSNQTTGGAKHAVEDLRLISMMLSEKPLVVEEEVISRDIDNKHKIVRMLTESNKGKLSVIPIIGLPGTGKTSLVRQVYHDRRVHEYFAIKHWVCMTDSNGGPSKLLDLVFRQRTSDIVIREAFNTIVTGKKYLLILDGVTQGNHGAFLNELLSNVSDGSKVVLIAHDMIRLENLEPLPVVEGAPFEVGTLPGDESWTLFKGIAFGDEIEKHSSKSEDGFRIYEICARIPRLLKNVASLLRTTEDWKNLRYIDNSVQAFLSKFNLGSYKEVPSNIQRCILYCSLFPENYEFSQADLIHLWHAQEYLTRTAPESVGDEYFMELQKSGNFFQDSKSDGKNAEVCYKMDSLMNEFLRSVAKPEICLVDDHIGETHTANVLHLSFPVVESPWEAPSWLPDAKQLKSLLFLPCKSATVVSVPKLDELLSSLSSLRVLDLAAVDCENLPDSLGELSDLRYLRLGVSSEYLPRSITNLKELQTLDLRQSNVIVLPRGFNKLVGLRHLYTGDRLLDLPPKFGELTSLQTLDVFIVGENNTLDTLTQLSSLVGKLKIRYKKKYVKDEIIDTSGLLKDTHLTDISLIWSSSYDEAAADEFTCLEPPPTIKSLSVCRWKGMNFPQQLMNAFPILSSLVYLHIEDCSRCQNLPSLSSLSHLRSLQLWDLSALQYIEDRSVNNKTSCMADHYFPSLEYLMLANLPNLRRWSPENDHKQQIFPTLLELRVSGCPTLMSMPQMQVLELLEVHDVNATLLENIMSSSSTERTLKNLTLVAVDGLDNFSIKAGLESLIIRQCRQLTNLVADNVILQRLQRLKVHECGKLVDISSALKHVKLLQELEIKQCEALNWEYMKQDADPNDWSSNSSRDVGAWQNLKELRSLRIMNFSNLESLPKGFCFLESLEELSLFSLHQWRVLPESMGNLSQLRQLAIRNCPHLTQLPESLASLSNLQQIQIHCCPKLKDIPERLETFDIKECPKLLRANQQPDGED